MEQELISADLPWESHKRWLVNGRYDCRILKQTAPGEHKPKMFKVHVTDTKRQKAIVKYLNPKAVQQSKIDMLDHVVKHCMAELTAYAARGK